ncbi:MAG: leucine-rich repeat domain-containing protein, partial [Lachnospiraceae bacterium]|nr:leucine-rich repeat domain-containing protein [Lachnospiraceae bacterium]
IDLPAGVTHIGNGAFEGCTGLTEIDLEACAGLTEIGEYAFAGSRGIVSVLLPDSVRVIGYRAFYSCTSLSEINYPAGLEEAGGGIYEGCESLRRITVPEGVTAIPENAFQGAEYLRYIYLPDSLASIGDAAFEGCKGLPYIYFNDSLSSIGNHAFNGCEGLISITIPGTVSTISYRAFSDCINLEEVSIGNGTTVIETEAFSGDTALTDIYIPETVESFGDDVFKGCTNLVIHCAQNSQASVYAIENDFEIVFYKETENTESVIDHERSFYELSTENALARGYITGTVVFNVKEGTEGISDRELRIKFPNNTSVLFESMMLDGVQVTDYSYDNSVLIIPINEGNSTFSFCLRPESNKRYDSYAVFAYTKDGTSRSDIIEVVSKTMPTLTINAAEDISSPSFTITGVAPGDTDVNIYLDDVLQTTVHSLKNGCYSADLTIPDPYNGMFYEVAAGIGSGEGTGDEAQTVTSTVWYIMGMPELTQFDLYYNNHADSKKDLLAKGTNGSAVSFNPEYPFTFVVDFDNDDSVDPESVEIISDKKGVTKSIPAAYDPATGKYIASGYFGGDSNYVPGKISVGYDVKESVYPAVTEDMLVALNQKLYAKEKASSETTVETFSDGSTLSTTKFLNLKELGKLADRTVLTYCKIYDKLNKDDLTVLADTGKLFDHYLNVEGDGFFVTVIDNWIENPTGEKEISGVLVLVGDTLDNKATKFIISVAGSADTAATVFPYLQIAGKACKAISKLEKLPSDVAKMREAVYARNYSPEEQARILAEIDVYDNAFAAYTVIAAIAGIGIVISPPGAAVYIGYLLVTAVADTLFEYWKYKLQKGESILDWIIDPSGYVYEGVTDNRLEGATVTAYYNDGSGGSVLWDASEYQQENPLLTDSGGRYAWDVPEGQWQVKAELDGYDTVTTGWYDVPPAQTDINIGMVSQEAPEVASVAVYEEYTEIWFTQYVDPASFEEIVIVDSEGNGIPYTVEYVEYGVDEEGNTLVISARLIYAEDEDPLTGPYTVEIPEIVSYNGQTTEPSEGVYEVLGVRTLTVPESLTVQSQQTVVLTGHIENGTGTEQIECSVDSPITAEAVSVSQPDENGDFTVELKGLLLGETEVTVSVAGTGLSEKTILTVTPGGTEPSPVLVDEITIDAENASYNEGLITVPAGGTLRMTAAAGPDSADNKNIIWSLEDYHDDAYDIDRAAIDPETGVLTTYSAGRVTVVASSEDGGCVARRSVMILFQDMTKSSSPFYKGVYWAVDEGITYGIQDKSGYFLIFGEERTCTRAQMVTFLWRLAGEPEPTGNSDITFADVTEKDANKYYYKPVLWAAENNITVGTKQADGTYLFKPQDPCLRRQAVMFLWRMAGEPHETITVEPFDDVPEYNKNGKKNVWYDPVMWAAQHNITTGVIGAGTRTFNEGGLCLRRQIVTFLYRYANPDWDKVN